MADVDACDELSTRTVNLRECVSLQKPKFVQNPRILKVDALGALSTDPKATCKHENRNSVV